MSSSWWRTTFATVVAAALVVWLVLSFPYGYTLSAAGKGAVLGITGLWSVFTTVTYYYAWTFRFVIIALSAAGYDWSAGYCTPNGAFSAIGFFGWKIEEMYAFNRNIRNICIDRSSADFVAYCMDSGWNAFGTMMFGHFLLFGFVVVSICFGELTRAVLETEYASHVSNQTFRLSATVREYIGTYAFLSVYPLCGIAHYLIRGKYSNYAYSTSLIITVVVLVLTMRCALFLYMCSMCDPRSPFEDFEVYMSSAPSYISYMPPLSSPPSLQSSPGVEGTEECVEGREECVEGREGNENERLLSVV